MVVHVSSVLIIIMLWAQAIVMLNVMVAVQANPYMD